MPFDKDVQELYAKYKDMAKDIICIGRLGSYKYMNMDETIMQAINAIEAIK